MKRGISTSISLLAKRKTQDLQNTLKFLAQTNKTTTISSLFEKQGTEAVHVQKVVDLLNHDLPDGEFHRRRVDAHYDILMSRLKHVVEKSVAQTGIEDSWSKLKYNLQERLSKCHSSEQLYGLLLELQVANKLTSAALTKIIMNRNFTHLNQVRDNLPGFSHELELAAMLSYRLRGPEASTLFEQYTKRWTSEWHDLAPMAQKLVWKCDYRQSGIALVSQRVREIRGWSAADSIGLYQTLYSVAYQLPSLQDHRLTKVQHLFVASLKALSLGICDSESARKMCLATVRASVENRLSSDCLQTKQDTGISVYQYRFMRRLDDILQLSARDPVISSQARNQIQDVMNTLHREEEQARSQMVLKFI
ncbi:LANO_0G04874g1_1 [Lachancea nothofagi CBS 11611]|uniref:LANO_0G04874g1_1 n=1 Tax=Lachancea nothofagi CBS 11611 TaxID=1266666 RepID=A0A1G4KGR9_9SACH|nr:LANO_0G04874g1_1 [Lachancea nothofagi CBS 11611]